MAWLTANWFWVLIFFAFISMHMVGHGGHGGHGGRRGAAPDSGSGEGNGDDRENRDARSGSGGHRH